MVYVDGSMMEGGGQLLRMALSYSAILSEPIIVDNIRVKRREQGLKPQHLTTLNALSKICDAKVKGSNIGNKRIEFIPGDIKGGNYSFDIGTAGSISLFLQCLIPVAVFADSKIQIRIIGGTDVKWSPTLTYLQNVILPAYYLMGLNVKVEIRKHGFYPKGGGIVDATIHPSSNIQPIKLPDKHGITTINGLSLCGKLPEHVARRQANSAQSFLEHNGYKSNIIYHQLVGSDSPQSPGSSICLWATAETPVFIGTDKLGERGLPAEKVGLSAAQSIIHQLSTKCTVDKHATDHLILPCSLANDDSSFTSTELTLHTMTAIKLAEIFMDTKFNVKGEVGKPAKIECTRGTSS